MVPSRIRRFRRVAVACGLVLAGIGAGGQQPLFRGEGDTVRVFVTVTDRDGRLVTSLSRTDFEIRDEGQPQPITIFENSPQPIQLIVMLDGSGSMAGNLPLLRDASRQLFVMLRPDDRVRVGWFGEAITISPTFTRDPEVLLAALPDEIAPAAPTPLWAALDEALTGFDDEDDTRRVVLVLSDGRDSGTFGLGRRPMSQAQVIDTARERDAMVYAIGMRSRRARFPIGVGLGALQSTLAADMPDPGLARVAEETGGGYFELRASDDLAATFTRVADELHRQYLIAFAVPERDGKVHDIDVRVSTRGLTPRARKDYVAPR